MKKTMKRLFTLVTAMIMLSALALPAFADWTLQPDSMTALSNNYLNINRTDSNTNMNGRTLILYRTTSPGFDQKFTVAYDSYNGRACAYFTKEENGMIYAINRSTSSYSYGPKAIMWRLDDGKKDSAFKRPKPDNKELVNLLNYNEGLRYVSDDPGARVYFGTGESSAWFASGDPSL